MKNHFKEHFLLSEEEKDNIWSNCYIVLDTNILLNFYRYSNETSEDMFNILDKVKDNLWLPYQVVWEYLNNRRELYYKNWNAANTLKEKLKQYIDNFYEDKEVSQLLERNPFVKKGEVVDAIDEAQKSINEVFEKYNQKIVDFTFKDSIMDKLSSLFDNKVGDDYKKDDLEKKYKIGQDRYNNKIPPGYKDNTNQKKAKGSRYVFGDLINWMQIIDKAKEDKKNIIFVSGDQKDDWWEVWQGKKIRPRVELIKEFKTESNMEILFYTQPSFMSYAKEKFNITTRDKSITEVEEVEETLKQEEILDNYKKFILPVEPLIDKEKFLNIKDKDNFINYLEEETLLDYFDYLKVRPRRPGFYAYFDENGNINNSISDYFNESELSGRTSFENIIKPRGSNPFKISSSPQKDKNAPQKD